MSFYTGKAHPEISWWAFIQEKVILISQGELLPRKISPKDLRVSVYKEEKTLWDLRELLPMKISPWNLRMTLILIIIWIDGMKWCMIQFIAHQADLEFCFWIWKMIFNQIWHQIRIREVEIVLYKLILSKKKNDEISRKLGLCTDMKC